jgi:hypothetical protein
MERREINSDNYEAFYLDYLEGNLSAEESAQLQSFLLLHPELELDFDDVPPLLLAHTLPLQHDFKRGLKHVDLLNDAISEQNTEEFIIAHHEGLLSEQRSEELFLFVQTNTALQHLFTAYGRIRLESPTQEIYPNKADLKRKSSRIVPLLYLSGAAAAIVVLFLAYRFNSAAVTQDNAPVTALKKSEPKTEKQGTDVQTSEEPQPFSWNTSPIDLDNPFAPQQSQHDTESVPDVRINPEIEPQETRVEAPELAMDTPIVTPQPEENSLAVLNTAEKNKVGADEFVNPIFPVTNVLTNVLNKEVDFGTTRKEVADGRGFYIKIGKFELSHNASRASR